MRRNIKIIISAVLIMTLIISVTACKSENKNLAKGRYVETQCKIQLKMMMRKKRQNQYIIFQKMVEIHGIRKILLMNI